MLFPSHSQHLSFTNIFSKNLFLPKCIHIPLQFAFYFCFLIYRYSEPCIQCEQMGHFWSCHSPNCRPWDCSQSWHWTWLYCFPKHRKVQDLWARNESTLWSPNELWEANGKNLERLLQRRLQGLLSKEPALLFGRKWVGFFGEIQSYKDTRGHGKLRLSW